MLKYEEARLRIMDYIRRQKLKSGDSIPPQMELVKFCNCSLITIKRALTNLQKAGVIERSQGRTARLKHTDGVFSPPRPVRRRTRPAPGGCILLLQRYYKYQSIFEEASITELYLRDLGFSLIYEKAMVPAEMEDYDFSGISGVVLYGWITPEWVSLLRKRSIPCIVAGNNYCPGLIKSISYDYVQGASLLYDTMRRHGCRRIAMIAGRRNLLLFQTMHEVWRSRLLADGIDDCDPLYCHCGDQEVMLSERTLRDFLLHADFDGLIAGNREILPVLANLCDLNLADKCRSIGLFTEDMVSLPFNGPHGRIFIMSTHKKVIVAAASELVAALTEKRPLRSRKIPFCLYPKDESRSGREATRTSTNTGKTENTRKIHARDVGRHEIMGQQYS